MKSFHGNSSSASTLNSSQIMQHFQLTSSLNRSPSRFNKGKQPATVAQQLVRGLSSSADTDLSIMSGSPPACDSGYCSSTHEDSWEDKKVASTSDWIPSTPLSPPPESTFATGYFDTEHRTSPSTPPSSPSGHPTLPRTRSRTQSIATVPPPYHPAFARFILRRQQSIYSREEEGHERLPEYSCDIHLEGWMARKVEQNEPGVKAKGRTWKHEYVVIHGTTMKVFKHNLADATRGTKSNALLHSYSLRDAQVGRAIDYAKAPFAVRVRADGHQMLFKLDDHEATVQLIETLRAAVNISSDLDERDLPTFVTLPRSRRRDPRAIRAAYAAMGMTREAEAIDLGATGGTRAQAAEEGIALEGDIY